MLKFVKRTTLPLGLVWAKRKGKRPTARKATTHTKIKMIQYIKQITDQQTHYMRSMNSSMLTISFNRILVFITFLSMPLLFFSCKSMAPSSTSVNPYHFKYVPAADKRQYVVMKDSSVVYGEKVVGWSLGVFSKKLLRLDDRSIPASEVLGFQNKEGYWIRLKDDAVAKRMVTGRISVYRQFVDTQHGGYTLIYFQKAGGPVKETSWDELKQMLRDCPKAYDMINIPRDEYLKIVKKEPYYTQTVVETYNNCGEWQ